MVKSLNGWSATARLLASEGYLDVSPALPLEPRERGRALTGQLSITDTVPTEIDFWQVAGIAALMGLFIVVMIVCFIRIFQSRHL